MATTPWWLHEDTLRSIERELASCGHVVLDHFVNEPGVVASLRQRCLDLQMSTAKPENFEELTTRSDLLISCLAESSCSEVNENICRLSCSLSRLRPGDSQGQHVDLPGRQPGRLSVVYYLQDSTWDAARDGGCLRIFKTDGSACNTHARDEQHHADREQADGMLTDIAPLADRLVLFFSDGRCPHAVLPAAAERYAAVLFYGCKETSRVDDEDDELADAQWDVFEQPSGDNGPGDPNGSTDDAVDDEDLLWRRTVLEDLYEELGPTATNFSGLRSDELLMLTSEEYGGKGAHVYGDTDSELLFYLFETLRPVTANDTFCDLGSGNGRLLLQMSLLTRVRSVAGVELSRTRHEQATAALAEATRRGVFASARAGSIELSCGSMLGHPALAMSTLCFCYSLALDVSFMATLELELAQQLPLNALVLLRGQGFPGVTTQGDGVDAAAGQGGGRKLQPVLETRIANRMHQFYGYRVVAGVSAVCSPPPDQPEPVIRLLELEQHSLPLGSSRFERAVFVPSELDEEPSMQDLFEADGGIDALCSRVG